MQKIAKIMSVGLLMLGSLAAHATSLLWDFSYVGTGIAATGVITTDSILNSGAYLVTGITGQRNGESIVSLVPAGTFGNLFSDNLLFSAGPYLDYAGITFLTSSGAYNLCYDGPNCGASGYQDISGQPVVFTPVQLKVTSVPEPATLGMLGFGLVSLAFVRRRNRTKA